MPRNARRKVAQIPLHIVQRGVDRCATFRTVDDRVLYMGLLNELPPLFACSVHAYVLMTNHVHLLLTSEIAEGASSLMKHLGQRYVQGFNRAHQRTGPLFEGRFKSHPVDSNEYLIRCQRYIELNPVRAGMVRAPWEYPWSSFRANADLDISMVVTPHPFFLRLGETRDEQIRRYREFFDNPPGEAELAEIRHAINSGSAWGSAQFLADLEARLERRAKARARGRPPRDRDVLPGGKRGLSPV